MKKLLALCLAFSATVGCFVGCKEKSDDGDTSSSGAQKPSVEFTEYDLVSGGNSQYAVVYSDTAINREIKAVDEFTYFFEEATGIVLQAYTESQVTYDKDAKLIVLGNCETLKNAAGVTVDYDTLGLNGYRLDTKDSNLFVSGGKQYGALYGAYELLRILFDFEVYTADEIVINRNVRNLKLPDLSKEVVPDIQQMVSAYGKLIDDAEFALRMGHEAWTDVWIHTNGSHAHNLYDYVNPDDYPDHPEWFRNEQLCLNNEEMYEVFLPKLKKYIENSPTLNNITITQRDKATWCDCEACTADKEKYGSNSGTMVKFMNKVSRDIDAWFEEEGSDREINLIFFAYHGTTTPPPTRYNEATKTYEPIDDEVICADNVVVA